MDAHLGYDKHNPEGDRSGNSRNGYGKKTIKSEWWEAEIEMRIMAMYGKGMSTREIEEYVKDIYGVEVSLALVSKITDRIMPEVRGMAEPCT